jgi:hypothetical protein
LPLPQAKASGTARDGLSRWHGLDKVRFRHGIDVPGIGLEQGRKRMRSLAIALAICVATTGAYAQTAATTPRTPSCHDEATTKKLAGAALTSFMKKCQTDSATSCDTAASDKKLAGAAKTSFAKKCVTDSVGQ